MKNQNYRVWLFFTFLFMMVIYSISNMPYEAQDIKPLLENNIQMNSTSVPNVQIQYDHQAVSSSSPYEFVEFLFRKAGHIIGYCALTLLWIKTLRYTKLKLGKKLLYSILSVFPYVLIIEDGRGLGEVNRSPAYLPFEGESSAILESLNLVCSFYLLRHIQPVKFHVKSFKKGCDHLAQLFPQIETVPN
ncbi:VanZ family protein [Rossellomorea vietnamensis]|uniref:VanZ family protein n=1 Tax=Rossellomorea vietnamensis TaxID=218284 RepID=UPI003D28C1FF